MPNRERAGPSFETDYYLENRPLQPKAEIADYIEHCGILVPKRYTTLSEAIESDRPFIMRSEHPQDLDGASGVTQSLFVDPTKTFNTSWSESAIDWESHVDGSGYGKSRYVVAKQISSRIKNLQEKEVIDSLKKYSLPHVKNYCKYAELGVKEFMNGLSFSYWEALSGMNRAIVADNAVANRYHVFSMDNEQENGVIYDKEYDYKIIENGQLVGQSRHTTPTFNEPFENILSLIEFYEQVRNLPRFNVNQCPIIEAQTRGDKNYFLQYYVGKDFSSADFSLDRAPQEDEIEALFVRGATPPDGINFKVGIHHGRSKDEPKELTFEGAVDYTYNPWFIEAQLKQRKLHIILERHLASFFIQDSGHLPRSRLFKPEVTIVLPKEDFYKIDDTHYEYMGETPTIDVHVVSDGRKAYLKKISSPES